MERAGAEVFEKLPVGQAVRRQIVPSVVSQMVTLIYSLADTYFVGLLNEPRQSAAITLVYPSFVMLTAVSNLFGAGGASLIAQRLGKNKEKDAREISSAAWCGSVFRASVFQSGASGAYALRCDGGNLSNSSWLRALGHCAGRTFCNIKFFAGKPAACGRVRGGGVLWHFCWRYTEYDFRPVFHTAHIFGIWRSWCRHSNGIVQSAFNRLFYFHDMAETENFSHYH